MRCFLNASCRYIVIRMATDGRKKLPLCMKLALLPGMKTLRSLSFCIAALLLSSCRDDGFLPLAEAQAFNASSDISAAEANALPDAHLQRIGKSPRLGQCSYNRCYIRHGEYYFLNTMEKDGSYDGYAVNATTGRIRQVNDVAHKLLPRYSYEEQNAALFPAEE